MDKEYLFSELKKYERKLPELQRHKDYLFFIHQYAPDKLKEAKTVADERKEKIESMTKRKFNNFYKY